MTEKERKRLDPVNHPCRWLPGAGFHVGGKHKHKKRPHVIVHNLSWIDDVTIFSVLFLEFDALGNHQTEKFRNSPISLIFFL